MCNASNTRIVIMTTLVLVHGPSGVEDTSIFKECPRCGTFTSLYSKNSSTIDGLCRVCKPCKSIEDKAYRDRYPEKMKALSRGYYLKNSSSIKAKVKEYSYINSDSIKEKRKEYFQKNKEKFNQYSKDRAKIDPVYRLKSHMRKRIIKAVSGKSKSTLDIIGCSYEELRIHIESQFEPWMNWENKGLYNGEINHGWDIDHIIPLSSAKSPEEVLYLNHYTNLRPLCSHVNRNIKRDKYEQPT
jgi:hypothetical protein